MYNLFSRRNRFDDSPFQFARMEYLKSRIDQNYQSLATLRESYAGRLDSSHLLIKLLMNLNVEFSGDLISYMESVDLAAKRLCSMLGITSSFSRGAMFTEGVFYPDCPEIIIYARNQSIGAMDLWKDWRSVESIRVLRHPIDSLRVIEPAVMNEVNIASPSLAIILIDIPLLAGQWKLWQSGNPSGTLESFITQVPLVAMVKSHLNVALFNRLLVKSGLKVTSSVSSNLPFAQTPLENHLDDLIDEILEKVTNKTMTANQTLSSIPVPYKTNYLDEVDCPETTPTHQILWALIASKIEKAAFSIHVGSKTSYSRMLNDITAIRRTIIVAREDKILSSGLSTSAETMIKTELNQLVISKLPPAV